MLYLIMYMLYMLNKKGRQTQPFEWWFVQAVTANVGLEAGWFLHIV